MPKSINIFLEGKADICFLENYLTFLFGETWKGKIKLLDCNGKDSLEKEIPGFNKNTTLGGLNLIIFDADSDFTNRQKEILEEGTRLGINFKLFLFPNNKDSGNLEELLRKLTVPEHEGIFDCFQIFEKCLHSKNTSYDVPNLKLQIYSYFSFQKKEPKEHKRNYLEKSLWNLTHEYLSPLKEFLEDNCK